MLQFHRYRELRDRGDLVLSLCYRREAVTATLPTELFARQGNFVQTL